MPHRCTVYAGLYKVLGCHHQYTIPHQSRYLVAINEDSFKIPKKYRNSNLMTAVIHVYLIFKKITKLHKLIKLPSDSITLDLDADSINKIRDKSQIHDFNMLYKDKDFDSFINLTEISELYNKCDIKVIINETEKAVVTPPSASTSIPEKDIYLINVPDFDAEVKAYSSNTINTADETLPDKIRRKIVAHLGNSMIGRSSYPSGKDVKTLGIKLVEQYPVLRESGPGSFASLIISVKFKIDNLRRTLKKNVPEIQ